MLVSKTGNNIFDGFCFVFGFFFLRFFFGRVVVDGESVDGLGNVLIGVDDGSFDCNLSIFLDVFSKLFI